tara:strand:+ start:452 stop:712 length:261 start_codon:yes stop_codon:yes gene_type:complete
MRLPIIRQLVHFIQEKDEDFVLETIVTLEDLSINESLKDEEIDSIGELLSNLYGAIEVFKEINKGKSEREALNCFMQRVTGSIDNK